MRPSTFAIKRSQILVLTKSFFADSDLMIPGAEYLISRTLRPIVPAQPRPSPPELHPKQQGGRTVPARPTRWMRIAGLAEAEALVNMARPRIVLEDIEPEPVHTPLTEHQPADRKHGAPAEPAAGR